MLIIIVLAKKKINHVQFPTDLPAYLTITTHLFDNLPQPKKQYQIHVYKGKTSKNNRKLQSLSEVRTWNMKINNKQISYNFHLLRVWSSQGEGGSDKGWMQPEDGYKWVHMGTNGCFQGPWSDFIWLFHGPWVFSIPSQCLFSPSDLVYFTLDDKTLVYFLWFLIKLFKQISF